MRKLFIQPQHGKLGEVVKTLREADYEVTIIGWGYPPMYVTADEGHYETIKEMTYLVDDKAEFALFRADLIEKPQLIGVLKTFKVAELRQVCLLLDVDFQRLQLTVGNDLDSLAIDLIGRYDRPVDWAKLIQAVHDTNADALLDIVS